jgi:manganese/zinc/iron transport system permease protein
LVALTALNALFLTVFYKELKLSTFDAGLAATLGFMPVMLHYLLMGVVAVTTVGAFSAVGAILSVALIIVPPVTASLLTQRLAVLIWLSVLIGAVAGLGGYAVSAIWDVSPSGMIATVLGVIFGFVLMVAPKQGLIAQAIRRRRQRTQFALEMLVVHLSTHENTPQQDQESTLLHLEQELGWSVDKAAWITSHAEREGLVHNRDGGLTLTPDGHKLARAISAR